MVCSFQRVSMQLLTLKTRRKTCWNFTSPWLAKTLTLKTCQMMMRNDCFPIHLSSTINPYSLLLFLILIDILIYIICSILPIELYFIIWRFLFKDYVFKDLWNNQPLLDLLSHASVRIRQSILMKGIILSNFNWSFYLINSSLILF